MHDLKQEYVKAVPELPALIDALNQQISPFDSIGSLEEHLTSRLPSIVAAHDARWCVNRLWEASVIGAKIGGSRTRFRSTDPTLLLPFDRKIYVHQGLARGLNIKERRS